MSFAPHLPPATCTRITGDTNEHVIIGARGILHAIIPDAATTGTVTLRDSATAAGSAAFSVAAIGLLPAGKTFGPSGLRFDAGMTVQLSQAADAVLVLWTPFPAGV